MRARLAWLVAGAAVACTGCVVPPADGTAGSSPSETAPLPRGYLPFVWPRNGVVSLLLCRFDTARPIGVYAEGATPEESTALTRALHAIEEGGLGIRFLEAPREHAQIQLAFGSEPSVLGARSVVECKLGANGDAPAVEIARARIEIARTVATARSVARPLTREELLGVLARELGRALGFSGAAPARDPIGARSLADARRIGAALRSGAALDSPALRALYARASGSDLASAPAEPPLATRPVDRLARLAETHGLDGPYLRTSADAARVFWRDAASGDEYGAQVLAPARLMRAPGRIAVALEPRARRSLPRSRDVAP